MLLQVRKNTFFVLHSQLRDLSSFPARLFLRHLFLTLFFSDRASSLDLLSSIVSTLCDSFQVTVAGFAALIRSDVRLEVRQ